MCDLVIHWQLMGIVLRLCLVAHTCNPRTSEAKVGISNKFDVSLDYRLDFITKIWTVKQTWHHLCSAEILCAGFESAHSKLTYLLTSCPGYQIPADQHDARIPWSKQCGKEKVSSGLWQLVDLCLSCVSAPILGFFNDAIMKVNHIFVFLNQHLVCRGQGIFQDLNSAL